MVRREGYVQEYVIRQEDRLRVWRALECVSEVSRSCIILRWMLGFSLQEIADVHSRSTRQILRYIRIGRSEFKSAYLLQLPEQNSAKQQIPEQNPTERKSEQ